MNILAIETSAGAASAAVCTDGDMTALCYQNNGLTHSKTLMVMVESMLKSANLALADMSLVAVASGPGSFTGLRIGVAAAKGLAWAGGLPCCAASTLESMALGAACAGKPICAVMDARRSQVYNALFDIQDGAAVRMCPDRAVSLEQLEEDILKSKKSFILVGDGAAMCYNAFKKNGLPVTLAPQQLRFQNAWGVALAARQAVEHGALVSANELKPTYLRLSQAEREKLEKQSGLLGAEKA